MSYQTDIEADVLLSENGHEDLRMYHGEKNRTEQKSRIENTPPWTPEQGRTFLSTHAPAHWWDLPLSPPLKNGQHYTPSLAQPHPADLIDAEDSPPTQRERARGMLSWCLRMLDMTLENRSECKMTGNQIALAVLTGHPKFIGRSM